MKITVLLNYMIIQCNSCKKKFNVPDAAITDSGRLVQCSSCGGKWTQYPIKAANNKIIKKNENLEKAISPILKKKKSKKKRAINLYTKEYLKEKHGIKVIDPSTAPSINAKNKFNNKTNYGFYNTVITFLVFFISFFGVVNLTNEIIIEKYPFFENYINYFFETLNNLKLIFEDLIRSY